MLDPKGFEDVENLEIIMRDYGLNLDHPTGIPIPPKGSLQTINNTFKFERIAVGAKEIVFQTEELNGISYKLTGRFLNRPYCEIEGDQPELTGRLIKFKDGKWEASTQADLYITCGC